MILYPEGLYLLAYMLLLTGLLLQTLLTVVQFFRRKKHRKRGRELFYFCIQFVLTVIATYNLSSIDNFGTAYYLYLSIYSYPLFLIVFLRSIRVGRKVYRAMQNEITVFSILEAIDNLGSGLLFYEVQGQILLINSAMKQIIYQMFGKEFLNGNVLWDAICRQANEKNGEARKSISLQIGECVYLFYLEEITVRNTEYLVLSVSDITSIHAQLMILKNKNQKLTESTAQVHTMLEKVDAIVDMKEKLRMKIILHDGLGQQYSLLKALIENYEQYAIEPNQLRPSRVIELLNASSEQTAEKSLEEIRQFFASIGIRIEKSVEGNLPAWVNRTFHRIAIECITNAIIHGNAKQITVAYSQESDHYLLCVENDGIPATGKITEGGGIKGMRFRVEATGGTLEVTNYAPFTVRAKIPKQKGSDAD
ncbi:MAG: sensor histidine kinase [Peptoniphilaceae bacterium]|jgi:signal transduction histidine kinase|nr:hypothetical protein [Bacillota bacterium]